MTSWRVSLNAKYPGQRLDLAGLAARAEDPVPVGKLGQRAPKILQPLRGQGKTHPELAGLAHIALDLGAHGGGARGAVELVEREPLGRLADIAQAVRVPGPVGLWDIGERILADPPVPGQRVAGEQVEGGGLSPGLGRALRRHIGEIDGGDTHMRDIEGGGCEHDRPVARKRCQDADKGLGHRLAAGAVGGIADEPLDGGLADRRQQVA